MIFENLILDLPGTRLLRMACHRRSYHLTAQTLARVLRRTVYAIISSLQHCASAPSLQTPSTLQVLHSDEHSFSKTPHIRRLQQCRKPRHDNELQSARPKNGEGFLFLKKIFSINRCQLRRPKSRPEQAVRSSGIAPCRGLLAASGK